jgi:hypothetical protein
VLLTAWGPPMRPFWWLGFASFGWIYLGLPIPFSFFRSQNLPTQALLELFGHVMGVPPLAIRAERGSELWDTTYQIGQSLWSILSALLVGFLASALFAAPSTRQEEITALTISSKMACY